MPKIEPITAEDIQKAFNDLSRSDQEIFLARLNMSYSLSNQGKFNIIKQIRQSRIEKTRSGNYVRLSHTFTSSRHSR